MLWAARAAAEDKAMRTLSIGTTGVAVKIRQGPAFDQLFTWSKHLGDRGATHGEASEREQRVHSLVASGAWPSYAWDEYQRLAAGSGQVDSGSLLRDYGVAFSVAEHASSEPLFRAAVSSDVNTVRRLLKDDYESDAALPDGTTALHAAALSDSIKVAKLLLDSADDARSLIEARGAHGLTALHTAAAANALKVVAELVRRGAVVDSRHAFANSTALHFAAEDGHHEIIEALCDAGADADASTTLGGRPLHALLECGASTEALLNNDTTPLYLAALEGHAAAARVLVKGGAKLTPTIQRSKGSASRAVAYPNDRNDWRPNSEPGNGATPLHAAAEHGYVEVVSILLEAGAPIDDRSMSGVSPLHLASGYERLQVLSLLLDKGATVDIGDMRGATPLQHGVASLQIVKALLERGADPNARRRDGATAVHAAASLGNVEVLSFLVQKGGLAASATEDGVTPLLVAATDETLIDALADASDLKAALEIPGPATDSIITHSREEKRGDAPLSMAVRKGARLAAKRLLKMGADPNLESEDSGCTSLHFAANNDDGHLVEALVKAGAVVDAVSVELGGSTPLYVAATRGATSAAVALLDAGADPDLAIDNGETPLLAAVEGNFIQVVRALLSEEAEAPVRTADPNKGAPSSSVRQAPLLLAVARGRVDAAAALLEAGANCAMLVASRPGEPPENLIDVARSKRNHAMLQLLVANEEACDVSLEDVESEED
jgi:ankyrin repeat protein